MNEFSQMVFAKVGFNSAVQGKVDIPEGASKLALVLPKAQDNRNDKALERKILSLSDAGIGVALMDLWDEDECCDINIVNNQEFLETRVAEILEWAKTYKAFLGAEIIIVGVETTGELLQKKYLGKSITIDANTTTKDLQKLLELA